MPYSNYSTDMLHVKAFVENCMNAPPRMRALQHLVWDFDILSCPARAPLYTLAVTKTRDLDIYVAKHCLRSKPQMST